MTIQSKTIRSVKRALLPVAGRGTRMYPATSAVPKELLPVGTTPLIEFALDEIVAAGILEVVLVTARGKSAIEDHVEDWCRRRAEKIAVSYVRQPTQRGLGDAVLCAAHLVASDAFAVVLPDDLLVGTRQTLPRLMRMYEQSGTSVFAVQPISEDETHSYGVPSIRFSTSDGHAIDGIVEKPGPAVAPSRLGVVGRYILPPRILGLLETVTPGKGGEIQLTDALNMLASTEGAWGVDLRQRRIDCGSPAGLLEAQLCVAPATGAVERDTAPVALASVAGHLRVATRDGSRIQPPGAVNGHKR
jgi:UTP--glucose-1-phosphate uridylyltransferase